MFTKNFFQKNTPKAFKQIEERFYKDDAWIHRKTLTLEELTSKAHFFTQISNSIQISIPVIFDHQKDNLKTVLTEFNIPIDLKKINSMTFSNQPEIRISKVIKGDIFEIDYVHYPNSTWYSSGKPELKYHENFQAIPSFNPLLNKTTLKLFPENHEAREFYNKSSSVMPSQASLIEGQEEERIPPPVYKELDQSNPVGQETQDVIHYLSSQNI